MTGRDDATVTRSEEELRIDRMREEAGTVGVHKRVESFTVNEDVPVERESFGGVERIRPFDGDSGEVEVLEDGAVSIPILEEEIVISRRLVVRERVIVRKTTETDVERIRAELRRERIEIDDRDGLLARDASSATGTQEGTTDGSTSDTRPRRSAR